MKKNQVLWSAFFLLCIVLPPTAQAGLMQKIIGEWQGNGYQYDGARWSIEIIVSPSGSVSISYPSLKCGGVLTLLEESETGARFRENLRYGKECINQGTVRLIQLKPEHLEFFWYLPGGELQAKGELVQVKKFPPALGPPSAPAPFHGPK
ncbi:MAG: hypothetical protein HY892_02825 [Deltaproteobacteria bacterium]|nr:hypothetical protein [Deltaproteobacteria bacterium]